VREEDQRFGRAEHFAFRPGYRLALLGREFPRDIRAALAQQGARGGDNLRPTLGRERRPLAERRPGGCRSAATVSRRGIRELTDYRRGNGGILPPVRAPVDALAPFAGNVVHAPAPIGVRWRSAGGFGV
jgi:hypothetical protein